MTVQLEVGMTAIRRSGDRVGPAIRIPLILGNDSLFEMGLSAYRQDGTAAFGCRDMQPIIAAGYPWADLGAKPGDTARCVWNGLKKTDDDDQNLASEYVYSHPDSLYVIVKRADAPKPADRPRAAHKLDLQDGDVVGLMAWQDESAKLVGHLFKFNNADKVLWGGADTAHGFHVPSQSLKGHRPLFRVISRAADAKQDEVFTIHKRDKAYHLTFPHGSDVGAVRREKF